MVPLLCKYQPNSDTPVLPFPPSLMLVIVRNIDERLQTISIEPTEPADTLVRLTSERFQIPLEQVRLLFRGNRVRGHNSIWSFGIGSPSSGSEDTYGPVFLVPSPAGNERHARPNFSASPLFPVVTGASDAFGVLQRNSHSGNPTAPVSADHTGLTPQQSPVRPRERLQRQPVTESVTAQSPAA